MGSYHFLYFIFGHPLNSIQKDDKLRDIYGGLVFNSIPLFLAYYLFPFVCLKRFCFFRGKQTINLCVEEGGPLPFSVDVLSAAFAYGNRCITKYPDGIVDYFKNSCPAGYTWERSFIFEGDAVCTASADITVRYIIPSNYSKRCCDD